MVKEQLLADVESLSAALKALPQSATVEKAIYHADRLHLAIRTSHNEGTRFAAFTVNKIVRDLGTEAPPVVVDTMARVRAGLEAVGLELHK
jgi:hypothetical protein